MFIIHITDYKYNINDCIKDSKRDFFIIDRFKQNSVRKNGNIEKVKKYKVHCNVCGGEPTLAQSQIDKNTCCPCCKNKQVISGINDIPTTEPWMVKYFPGGYDEAKNYTSGSEYMFFPICPDCGEQSKVKVITYNLKRQRTITCTCKDSFSYPEKFMYKLLEQLNVKFIYQLTKQTLKWVSSYRYDFYLPELNIIIETHGSQHYNIENVIQNDCDKKKLANINGVKYIPVNCSESNLPYIKNSIEKVFSEIFDLSLINWNECEEYALKNISIEVWDMFNKGCTVSEISKKLNISKNSVRRSLNSGNSIGKCNYLGVVETKNINHNNNYNAKEISVYTQDGNYISTYESAKYISDNSIELFGEKFRVNGIYDCSNHRIKHYKGYIFKKIRRIDEIQIIQR